jgi:S1-C subfamily serine protease
MLDPHARRRPERPHGGALTPRLPSAATLAVALLLTVPAPTLGAAMAGRAGEGGPPQSTTPTTPTPAGTGAVHYCPVCGAQNRSDSRFCLKDGSPLPLIDPGRFRPGFVRVAGTYSTDEIERMMHAAADSVVRIRVRTTSTYKYPVVYWKDEEAEYFRRAQLGKIETSDNDARLAGSGFVVSRDGEIVTNAHVANPDGMKADLTVETEDGRSFPARLIGVDPASDLALLKIDTDSLPPLAWGDSSALRVGQETWAIGNPLDIGISITRGTISSLAGTRTGINQVEAFVHSDAHITHGNSGGPLVDVVGHVLGVSDIVFSESKGQGYSIPSRMAQLVVDRLRRLGRYDRGFVGLHIRPVDSDSVTKYGLTRNDGSVVEEVLKGTPAETAGLAPGDVLFGINGHQAGSTYLLQEAVSSVGPGASLKLMVDRRGKVLELALTTVLRPGAPRTDPLQELQGYLRLWFEEDPKKMQVIIRDPHRSRKAPGLYEGFRVKTVVPAQDWPEEPVTLNYYRTRAKPIPIGSLNDLRSALKRAYVGGRMAATFEIDNPPAPIASVAFDEIWPIIL